MTDPAEIILSMDAQKVSGRSRFVFCAFLYFKTAYLFMVSGTVDDFFVKIMKNI